MRRRFTFSRTNRNSQGRPRASTMTSSDTASIPSSSRPRSSTSPVPSMPAADAWDDADATRCYNFIDEPGYFCPASPLIERQPMEEELEDNMKHACALLVQSIERGIPIWPSAHQEFQPRYPAENNAAQSPTGETTLETTPDDQIQLQHTHLAPPKSLGYSEIQALKGQHDSGVAMSIHSLGDSSKTYHNSLSAANGRFYGKHHSTTPPADELSERGRSRSRSFATHTSSPRSQSQSHSRSRSSSPSFFPYSPPKIDAQLPHFNNCTPDSPTELPSNLNTFLGTEGIMTWLPASLISSDNHISNSTGRKDSRMASAPGTSAGPFLDPNTPSTAPRRFYSTRQTSSKWTHGACEWAACELCCSSRPDSVVDYTLSLQRFGDARGHSAHGVSFSPWSARDVQPLRSTGFEYRENVYSVVSPAEGEPRPRRKKASHLLKMLAGLGIRRKEVVEVAG